MTEQPGGREEIPVPYRPRASEVPIEDAAARFRDVMGAELARLAAEGKLAQSKGEPAA